MELSFTYYLLVTSIVIFSLYIIEKSQIGVYLNVHKIFILVLISREYSPLKKISST